MTSRPDLTDILTVCLRAIESGKSSIEECVAHYPDVEELGDLLRAALIVRAQPRPKMASLHKTALERRLLTSYNERYRPSRRTFWLRLSFALAAVLLILAVSSVVLARLSDYAMPGEALYTVKRAVERVELTLANGGSRPGVLAAIARSRLDEIQTLAIRRQPIDADFLTGMTVSLNEAIVAQLDSESQVALYNKGVEVLQLAKSLDASHAEQYAAAIDSITVPAPALVLTSTVTPTPLPTATWTATTRPSNTPPPSPSPTNTVLPPSPTHTTIPAATNTPAPTQTIAPSSTATTTPSRTKTATRTRTSTPSPVPPTPKPPASATLLPSQTARPVSPTVLPSQTPAPAQPTATESLTLPPCPTVTLTPADQTSTPTSTLLPGQTPTATVTPLPCVTITPTVIASRAPTNTPSSTSTDTPSPTLTPTLPPTLTSTDIPTDRPTSLPVTKEATATPTPSG